MPNKILLVDESAAVSASIEEILGGYEVVTARDGAEAVQLLDGEADIAVAILDMRQDASAELLRELGRGKADSLRVIVLSDSGSAEDEQACLDLGAHDYIRKSLQMQTLRTRVKNQLDIVQMKRSADQNMKNLARLFEAVFQQAPIGISVSHSSEPTGDGEETIFAVNSMYEKICGRSKDELLRLGWADITHPDDLEEDLNQFRKLKAGEIASYSMDKRFIRPGGSFVWVHMVVAALDVLNDNTYNHICLIQDITEQKAMISQLEETRKLFRTFIDSSQDLVFLKDDSFRHVIANKVSADFYGTSLKKMIGKSDFDLMNAVSAEECRNTDHEVIRKNKCVCFNRIINGRVFETRKFPVSFGPGKTGVGAYVRDITIEHEQQEIINKISETNRIITECMLKPFGNIQEQFDYALQEAIKLTGSQFGHIDFYDENNKEFALNSWTNADSDHCVVFEKQTGYHKAGIWGEVILKRKPLIINDYEAPNPLKKGLPEFHVRIQKYLAIPIFENGSIVAVVGFANKKSDYTENDIYTMTVLMSGVWIAAQKKEKEKEKELLLARTQSMINDHEAVMLLFEPRSGRIIEANRAATNFYGYTKKELLGMTIQNISTLKEPESQKMRFKALHKKQRYFTFPHRLKNGEIRTVDIYSSPINYNGEQVLFSIIFDVTAREEASKQILYLAYHDYLTGLYNRRYFDEAFCRLCGGDANASPPAILIGDINGLKLYNDSFGHVEGDKALLDIAERIKESIDENDILARVGGDEFAVIVTGRKEESDIRKYMDQIEQKVNTGDKKNNLTISFGYGIQRNKEDTPDDLLKEAEAFMYNKKYYNSRSARSNAVNVIMETLFAKSERERNHSQRVGFLCEAIAAGMQLDKQSVDKIRVAGFLHDIGKIGIAESILNKIGKLDKKEWETMKLHSAKGAGILDNTVEFREIADIVLSHHERYDGKGYPNGLKGKEIPLESRIIAIADAFDAMTNDRTYRNKMSGEAVINELKRCSGTHFDPDIVSVFVAEVLPNEAFRERCGSRSSDETLPVT